MKFDLILAVDDGDGRERSIWWGRGWTLTSLPRQFRRQGEGYLLGHPTKSNALAAKASEFVVYYRIRSDGYFLYGEGDDPSGYGGTKQIAETTTFTSAQKARELGEAYLRASRSNPERSEIVVLKQAS
jgi:hypothetical protein